MKKYIHYCWFGNNPLPKLAKKCIKSWQKYLPDYEIIKWSEENVDLNECPFIKEAYENKKWAFVADYARTKAMYEYGGIYFDTDMEVTKDITNLLSDETFLGVEDSNLIACGVWYEKHPKSFLSKNMLDFYRSLEHFSSEDYFEYSIPRIITKVIDDDNFDGTKNEIQKLKNNIKIYPREYFYPLSYDHKNNVFTDNTCMIHYYDATWVPDWEKRELKIFRIFGRKNGEFIIKAIKKTKRIAKRGIKLCLYPLVLYVRYKKKINNEYLENIDKLENNLINIKTDYIVFHPKWMGITNATKELFDNTVLSYDILRKKDVRKIGDIILKNNIKQVIFSGMCEGWGDLAKYLKSKNDKIKIKTFWHGNHSQVLEPFGWKMNEEIFDLHKQGIVDVMGTCKKSIMEFYKNQGYNAFFITNKVEYKNKFKKNKDDEVKIGIYAANSSDWRKNMFAQIGAISLIPNAVIDMVPLNNEAIRIAKTFGVKLVGENKPLSREDLFKRMSGNDINLYVTFSECAPMLPLESFEVNTICITGNNHHYFKGTELEKYLVVKNEASSEEIKNKIELCLKNQDEIFKLYKEFRNKNIKECNNNVKEFLRM